MSSDKPRQRAGTVIKNNLFILKMVWGISPARVLLVFADSLLGFTVWVFETVVFLRYILGAADAGRSFKAVAIFLSCSVLGFMLIDFFSAWMQQRFRLINDQKLYRELNRRLFDKACNVDIACYENADFYNSYTKAAAEVFTRAVSVTDNLATLVSAGLSSIYVMFVMYDINLWVGLMTLLPILSNLMLGKRINKLEYERAMDRVPFERRQAYVNRAVYLQKYAKEIRLTGIFGVLAQCYHDAMHGIFSVTNHYWKRIYFTAGLKNILCFPLLFEGTWMIGAILAMVTQTITVSEFAVLATAIVSSTWMVINFTDSLMASIKNALYIDNLTTFLNYREAIAEDQPGLPVPQTIESLELNDVSFRYRPEAPEVLSHLNLTLLRGEIVSLVGQNGSGKSTLIKLIMRLYDPTEGTIRLNGVDIRQYNLKAYRQLIGAAFQDYQLFSLSVKDNVLMGNDNEGDANQAVADALTKSGVADKIASLTKGIDTTLTREFDDNGAVLSGGEEQKVAIARSFAKKSAVLLLDEPSSALDPFAEHAMYRSFMALCRSGDGKDKISLFISHRLSSAAVADRVYMLQNGSIIESGSHEALMRRDGDYAAMFRKQAENYLLEEVAE